MTAPLHNPEAERGLLGLALTHHPVAERLATIEQLAVTDFLPTEHQHVWRAILTILDRDGHVDLTTVTAALAGTIATPDLLLADLLMEASDTGAIRDHVRLVKFDALRRRWDTAGTKLRAAAAEGDESLVAQAEQELATVTVTDETHDAAHVGDQVVAWLRDTGAVAISTGMPRLDTMIGGGLRPGDTTALGAWTGMGKSTWLDQVLDGAVKAGYTAHLYMNEMSVVDRGLRAVARDSKVPFNRLLRRDIGAHEAPDVIAAAGRISFGISRVEQWTADQIARHIRANRWGICAIDVLHNMPFKDTADLDRIVVTLAAAARSAGTHLILVCQFNEERAKAEILPRPVIRDIRGSGMIKNLCAQVLLLHRDQVKQDGVVFTGHEGLIMAKKARHGQEGGIAVYLVPSQMRFAEDRASLKAAA